MDSGGIMQSAPQSVQNQPMTYCCEFQKCYKQFKHKEHREQHYKSDHSTEIYISEIPESPENPLLPRFPERVERIGRSFKKAYPEHNPRGNSSMGSFIDLLATDHDRFAPHSSETGWNLPQSHSRHILQLPTEIMVKIFEFILVTPRHVTPLCIPYQVDSVTMEPTYHINDLGNEEQQILYRIKAIPNCKLGNGDLLHTKYEAEYRRPIDATVLRVCKGLHEIGQTLLYSKNIFTFDLNSHYYLANNTMVFLKERGASTNVQLQTTMPRSDEIKTFEIQNMIRNMYNVDNARDLSYWMRCDPFVYFLFCIGPTNASYIRKLRIVGTIFSSSEHFSGVHIYKGFRRSSATLNLSYFIKAYAPFISLYCPHIDIFDISIQGFIRRYFYERKIEGLKATLPKKPLDPKYDEFQEQDAKLGIEALKHARSFREEMRLKAMAEHEIRLDNLVALHLKPLIEEVTSKMKNLRALHLKRCSPPAWNECRVGMMYNKFQEPCKTQVEMDLVNDAKLAIAKAVCKRMRISEDTEEMERLCQRQMKKRLLT